MAETRIHNRHVALQEENNPLRRKIEDLTKDSPVHLPPPLHIPSYSNTAVPKCRDVHDDGIQHHRGRERLDNHQNRPDPRLLFPRHETTIYETHKSNEESQKEINRLRKKNEVLTREINEQHITHEELKKENAFLWKKNEKMTIEIHDKHGEMEEENNCLQMKMEEMTRTIYEQHITVEKLEKENAFLCKKNEEITRKIHDKHSDMEEVNNCLQMKIKEKTRIANKQEMYSNKKRELENMARVEKNKRENVENDLEHLKTAYALLSEKHEKCPKSHSSTTPENKKNEKRLNQCEHRMTESAIEYNALLETKEHLEKKCKEFESKNEHLEKRCKEFESKLEELVKNYEASMNDRINSKDDDSLVRQLDQLKSKEKELATEIIQVRQQLKSSNIELEETKTRLSKLMGQRLTDNNPNITDLSDKNRPTKLAERYSELHENEWADAFKDLNAIYNDEKKTIAMLTVILKEAACFCRNEADKQMEHLRKVLTLQFPLSVSRGQNVPDVINQQLKNSRKVMSEIAGTNIVETYIKRLKLLTSASARDALRVEKFLKEAFSLCWLMSIQDPPVVFDRLQKHGEEFNAELYRPFTQAGALVDFQVLPTMFLNEGGPVLYKGVAQGYSLTN